MEPKSSLFRLRTRGNGQDAAGAGVVSESASAENDEILQALIGDVRTMRQRFKDLGVEVRRQNSLLDSLQAAFARTRVRLDHTMHQLSRAGLTSVWHMWVLFIFVFVAFILLYVMLKTR
ncbi:hypothetical protein ERJ75_000132600 [Trypanosoma vivax]|uniref:Putative Golgi vesicular membrane trafficking protein n=1 Tax=Trypanosoma vivax (strain Y486) TaxID=1055687 RepID=G0TT45_TRYVY|nr:putative Golgi vesicular membrane trafficking protein [Trypanosoma vivax]KAH8619655.1 hypothetical protein ERJ75_000132600 [Trypanosoma vivax]CCC47126.1 putative Golgi vesicular membrane trafficking protein [Trypanosoma vivax Y486]